MVVNPVNGKLYVSNTEARNEIRFEGPGVFGGSTVQGHLAEARITRARAARTVQPRHLNKHIDYGVAPGAARTRRQHSLATPVDMVVASTARRSTSRRSARPRSASSTPPRSRTTRFESDPRPAATLHHRQRRRSERPRARRGAQPALRAHALRQRRRGRSTSPRAARSRTSRCTTPSRPRRGRPAVPLRRGRSRPANGEASCSSCHIFGDIDSLAWDLGNPDDVVTTNPMTINIALRGRRLRHPSTAPASSTDFHPMKGPMTTQTLRGMREQRRHALARRPLDRRLRHAIRSTTTLSFNNFIVAFPGLLGRDGAARRGRHAEVHRLRAADHAAAEPGARARQLAQRRASRRGRDFYVGPRPRRRHRPSGDLGFTCEGCHALDPAPGLLRHRRRGELRGRDADREDPAPAQHVHEGRHVRHAGDALLPARRQRLQGRPDPRLRLPARRQRSTRCSASSAPRSSTIPATVGFDGRNDGDDKRRDMEQFVLAFDSDLAPIVGQQITLTSTNGSVVQARIDLLIARARRRSSRRCSAARSPSATWS